MSTLAELFRFLKQRKKLWLIPLIAVLVVIGGLLLLAESSVIAPFLYTLF